jgi:hypothetical protein
MNDDFNTLLKTSLERKSPPPGFASRVAARLPAAPRRSWRRWAAIGVAAGLFAAMGGMQYQEYRQGREAKRQLLVALGITAQELDFARHKVEDWSKRSNGE